MQTLNVKHLPLVVCCGRQRAKNECSKATIAGSVIECRLYRQNAATYFTCSHINLVGLTDSVEGYTPQRCIIKMVFRLEKLGFPLCKWHKTPLLHRFRWILIVNPFDTENPSHRKIHTRLLPFLLNCHLTYWYIYKWYTNSGIENERTPFLIYTENLPIIWFSMLLLVYGTNTENLV